jgi:hypothetical protein
LHFPADDHAGKVLTLGRFLVDLGMLQVEDGAFDEAWQTALTILAAARSFGDEPNLMASIVRQTLWLQAARVFERCLTLGRVSDALLAAAQEALAHETSQPLMYNAFRGERAGVHILMTDLEAGKVDLSVISPNANKATEAYYFITGNSYRREHASMLRNLNDLVEAAKLPPAEMLRKLQELKKNHHQGILPRLSDAITGEVYEGVCGASVGPKSTLECAIAGIGVERFRLQYGRWPDSLEDVVTAKLLEKLPPAGYVGQPMIYRVTDDGVKLSINVPSPPGKTNEFRLWDESKRRQPPP